MTTKNKTKKVVKKKAAPVKKKVAAPKAKSQELVIRVEQQSVIPVVRPGDLDPMKEGGKYMLPKTWISEKQVLYMVQKTPKKYVYTRPAKGGGNWDYVTGSYVTKVLNYVFGWNWDFEILREGEKGGQVYVLGKLTVKDDHDHLVAKTQYGRADIKMKKNTTNIPLDYGNDLKAAATDCLKKCASMFGIAHDIYGKEEMKKEAGIDVKDEAPPADLGDQSHSDGEPTVQYGAPTKVRSRALPRDNTLICSNCGDDIDEAVFKFSKNVFKRALCRTCQANAKKR